MPTTADLIARRDRLEAAMDRGALEVEFGGERVRYRSFTEMERALDRLNRRIGDQPRVSKIQISSTKGL
jgi:hypothetical protein